ncbi:hypothetical protein F7725_006709 [Dissostichus mawsoni]|uniref:Uncharacterized protein n=1 Tax=Dissostichus mawsoni TaxID=36200 RepID=A0A7J5XW95_DISMA|nr:hypothetical protein F7725_006709 [Dissostichus mawsoni]
MVAVWLANVHRPNSLRAMVSSDSLFPLSLINGCTDKQTSWVKRSSSVRGGGMVGDNKGRIALDLPLPNSCALAGPACVQASPTPLYSHGQIVTDFFTARLNVFSSSLDTMSTISPTDFDSLEIQQQYNDINNRWDLAAETDWDNENSSARLFERSRIKALAGRKELVVLLRYSEQLPSCLNALSQAEPANRTRQIESVSESDRNENHIARQQDKRMDPFVIYLLGRPHPAALWN